VRFRTDSELDAGTIVLGLLNIGQRLDPRAE
jgi:hypothetical protein